MELYEGIHALLVHFAILVRRIIPVTFEGSASDVSVRGRARGGFRRHLDCRGSVLLS